MLREGDILLVKDGATLGIASLVKKLPKPATVNSSIAVIRPNQECLSEFLVTWFRSHSVQQLIDMMKGGMGVPHLFQSDIKCFSIAVPPRKEQEKILSFVQSESRKVDDVILAYTHNLELLSEYRTALIHECITGQRQVGKAISITILRRGANVHFRRAVLAAELIHRFHDEPTFGRVKLEKLIYLSETWADIDLQGQYERAAAGPFDNRALRSIESQIQRQKWYQPFKGKKGTRYLPLEKAGCHKQYFDRYWPEPRIKFERMIELLHPLNTERCEIVATLYAVWNDFLISQKLIVDEDMVSEVYKWHPNKSKISHERWLGAIQWMRKEKFFPGAVIG